VIVAAGPSNDGWLSAHGIVPVKGVHLMAASRGGRIVVSPATGQIKGRLLLSEGEKATLAEIVQRPGGFFWPFGFPVLNAPSDSQRRALIAPRNRKCTVRQSGVLFRYPQCSRFLGRRLQASLQVLCAGGRA